MRHAEARTDARGTGTGRAPTTTPVRTRTEPGLHESGALLELQRQAGNRAVAQALSVQRDPPDAGTGGSDLDTRRPVGGTVPAAVRSAVVDTAGRAPRVRQILDAIRTLRGDLAFPVKWSSRGTYHQAGEIWLDRTWTEAQLIVAVQHELTHLHTFLAGNEANISTMTRDAYVAAKMDDEIAAHAAGYVAHLQSGTTGAEPQGYTAFLAHLRATDAAALRDRRYARIEELARAWVRIQYRTGAPGWRTSNTDENYYDYWGAAWDRAHPGGATPRTP